ncbi:hypothetical protein BUALT_Bualt12G0080200 [Buddleja alternifolia]|uniref:PDZ domain-containing protein n=1 Tax=Buddleja alternifolia TaxID=168488 RepID=A0AAV6WXK3_9LAMI|nr:hypothetical protein BUALT_Bualt12G0080200 [Buddleja alternifolia]
MVGTNLKAETVKLMDNRSGKEAEMNVIIERLCQPGGPGLSGNLVDSEASFIIFLFALDYLFIYEHIGKLRNDYKDLTEKINQNIELLHSARLAPATASVGDSGPNAEDANVGLSSSFCNPIGGAMDVDVLVSRPFAMVDEITEASPAAEDGLQLGDQIVKFGTVEIGENLLQRLAAEAQKNHGQTVPLVVMRQGALINMTVTPRAWSGRGLLGTGNANASL